MVSALTKNFGNFVRSQRVSDIYISQECLSSHCNISKTHIGYIENGKNGLSLDTAKKIADALGVPLWKIIKNIEENKNPTQFYG